MHLSLPLAAHLTVGAGIDAMWLQDAVIFASPYRLDAATVEIPQEVPPSGLSPPPAETEGQQAADEPANASNDRFSDEATVGVGKDTCNSASDRAMPAAPVDTTALEVLRDTETAKDAHDELGLEHAQSVPISGSSTGACRNLGAWPCTDMPLGTTCLAISASVGCWTYARPAMHRSCSATEQQDTMTRAARKTLCRGNSERA
ncbi:hypothetical protein FN846DRAFT_886214 [Sphaerosporella brunnea]|uniref:Uncharacterized protein n=1 Tax=Sphaerosporella brunnea TaxID=1250544 RepID=A0A5J5F750_9PEZI|nr:hypothetical protein FN846DRAFT_887129 [Sphaerosporella brunnea]KAA8912563.1 hypothetical protein FN846DRAFT_887130 [Sphaerosporella brunnea]KAA8913957.1 hypothetical protein FN846DRAFT_886214 [Sphaerosporella brunnea]